MVVLSELKRVLSTGPVHVAAATACVLVCPVRCEAEMLHVESECSPGFIAHCCVAWASYLRSLGFSFLIYNMRSTSELLKDYVRERKEGFYKQGSTMNIILSTSAGQPA